MLEAVDRHLAALGAEAEAVLGPDAATVGRFLPAGRATAGAPAGGRATALADTQADRAALFAGLVDVVGRLGAGRPVVLVVDDVHLADESTGDWLRVAARRGRGLLAVVTTRPGAALPVAPDATLTLGPLDLATAARLVGDDRAAALHRRSGGHPLFLLALAASEGEGDGPGNGDALPVAVTAAVAERLAALGGAAPTLVAAAVLGPEVDVGLLADVLGRPAPVLLDDLEAGLAQRALVERGSGFAFAHELVREAAAATASASRRALLHRGAAHALRRRPDAEMLAVARHARLGGDRAQAARALVAAADAAAGRSDHRAALTLLDQAVTLTHPTGDLRAGRPAGPVTGAETPASPGGEWSASRPGSAAGIGPFGAPEHEPGGRPAPGPPAAEALLARARVRLVLRDLEGAADDAGAAIATGAGVAGFETAGWVAYYRRDLGAALRYAEEGVARAADDELRASCLCLAGRVRESQGELAAAEGRLTAALDAATPGLRPLAAIWLGTLRVHQGRTAEADDLLARGLLDRSQLAHPFAVPHTLDLAVPRRGDGRPGGGGAGRDRGAGGGHGGRGRPRHPVRPGGAQLPGLGAAGGGPGRRGRRPQRGGPRGDGGRPPGGALQPGDARPGRRAPGGRRPRRRHGPARRAPGPRPGRHGHGLVAARSGGHARRPAGTGRRPAGGGARRGGGGGAGGVRPGQRPPRRLRPGRRRPRPPRPRGDGRRPRARRTPTRPVPTWWPPSTPWSRSPGWRPGGGRPRRPG